MKRSTIVTCLILCATPMIAPRLSAGQKTAPKKNRPAAAEDRVTLPQETGIGTLELVTTFSGPMPTGVAVSSTGRIFVNFPRWGDKVDYTVTEMKGSQPTAYPPGIRQNVDSIKEGVKQEGSAQADALVSVQSVVIDSRDRLWILDTGSPLFAPTTVGGPKLIGVDLRTNKIFKKIIFPADVALPTTYLNDVRFDLRRGTEGMAYITDSAENGPNGIIVVDLASGKSFRRLNDHPSTKAVPGFLPIVEGQPIMKREPGKPPEYMKMGSDGIAIASDGKKLYYCPLASRHLYSVSTDALIDQTQTDEQVAATVIDEGDKGGGSDGLETDAQGRVYCTEYEHNGIARRRTDGTFETVVYDPRVLWPDTMSIAADGYLYFTNNQLHRQPNYHGGKDLRQRPYSLLRVNINSKPVKLDNATTAQK